MGKGRLNGKKNKHLFHRILVNKVILKIKFNNRLLESLSVFWILFSHNDISILGKLEGKEKQRGSVECSVSKATALVTPSEDLQSQGPGGAQQVPGQGLPQPHSYEEVRKHRHNSQPIKCLLPFIFPIMKHQKPSKEDSKRKTNWFLVLVMRQTEQKQNQSPTINTEMLHKTYQTMPTPSRTT